MDGLLFCEGRCLLVVMQFGGFTMCLLTLACLVDYFDFSLADVCTS